MTWFRRITFFLVLNISVVLMISLITSVFGLQPYMNASGYNLGSLIIFCLIYGMAGSFISLLISRPMAKWTMGVRVVDTDTRDPELRELVDTVHRLSTAAGITKMPQVGVYDSMEVNAFATGATKNRSLVAVSTGLLRQMDRKSVEGVLGHEVAHIANGDMVTMALLQGVVNAFVMVLARVIAFAIDQALRSRDERGGGLGYIGQMVAVFVLEMILFIPGSMVLAYFSRYREFRADAGGAKLAGRENMIAALRRLQSAQEINASPQVQQAPAYASMKISGARKVNLFSTHPPLELRIEKLQQSHGF